MNLEKELKETTDKKMDQFMDTPWSVIESYFKDQHLTQLVRHQLESYNNFATCQIQKTIDMF